VKLRCLTPIRHKRGGLGGLVVDNTSSETSVGTLQAKGKPLKCLVVISWPYTIGSVCTREWRFSSR
jgi:hypothetical protein